MKLEGGRHRDTTQVHPVRYSQSNGVNPVRYPLSNGVKGLSPEIIPCVGGRRCSYSGRHNSYSRNGQGGKNPTGSETVSRCQSADMNSGEPGYPQNESMRQQVPKDKELQKVSWQSDYPIVSVKSVKADGEKGIAGIRGDITDTSATPRGGEGMATKLMTLTMRAKENPKLRFTSLAHLLNEDFLLECLGELKKDKAPGIDGVCRSNLYPRIRMYSWGAE